MILVRLGVGVGEAVVLGDTNPRSLIDDPDEAIFLPGVPVPMAPADSTETHP